MAEGKKNNFGENVPISYSNCEVFLRALDQFDTRQKFAAEIQEKV